MLLCRMSKVVAQIMPVERCNLAHEKVRYSREIPPNCPDSSYIRVNPCKNEP